MAGIRDMSSVQRLGVTILAAILATVGMYFLIFKTMEADNQAAQNKLNEKIAKNEELKRYEPRTQELERELVSLKQQLEIQKTIVPDEREAAGFIHVMQNTASLAGVEIRRFTTKPGSTHEYYTEAPFEMDLDGTYYGLLDFFNRVAKLERIVNIEALQMSTLGPGSKAKKTYQYAPRETVAVNCIAKAFYSHEPSTPPPGQPTPAKK